MTTMAHDAHETVVGTTMDTTAARKAGAGLGLALLSALSFGLAGALGRGPLDAGWSPGAVTLVRVGLGALVVVPFGLAAMRGRWHLLRGNAVVVVGYGALAVAGAQFCYFSAVQHMKVFFVFTFF